MCSDCNILSFESNKKRVCFQCKKERQRLYNLAHKEDRKKRDKLKRQIKKHKLLQEQLKDKQSWKQSNLSSNLALSGH